MSDETWQRALESVSYATAGLFAKKNRGARNPVGVDLAKKALAAVCTKENMEDDDDDYMYSNTGIY